MLHVRPSGSKQGHIRHTGFTLIERVVVIVIPGVLAATAILRFVDSHIQAHEAALEAATYASG